MGKAERAHLGACLSQHRDEHGHLPFAHPTSAFCYSLSILFGYNRNSEFQEREAED